MADQTQLDRVDAPTENVSATATGEMPSRSSRKNGSRLPGGAPGSAGSFSAEQS